MPQRTKRSDFMLIFTTLNNGGVLEEYFENKDGTFSKKKVNSYSIGQGKIVCNSELSSIWSINSNGVKCLMAAGKDTKSPNETRFVSWGLEGNKNWKKAIVLDGGELITYWIQKDELEIIVFESNEDGRISRKSKESGRLDTELKCEVCDNTNGNQIKDSHSYKFVQDGIIQAEKITHCDNCEDGYYSYSVIKTDTLPAEKQPFGKESKYNEWKVEEELKEFDLGDRGTLVCKKSKAPQSKWSFDPPGKTTVGLPNNTFLAIVKREQATSDSSKSKTVSNRSLEERVSNLESVISDLQGTLHNLMARLP
jgi:hypothetical protein